MSNSSSIQISAVVCALNKTPTLQHTVEQLQFTLPADSEIVVVDDGSTDGGANFLKMEDTSIRLLQTQRLGAAKVRNWGATHAQGNVIIFADAHIDTPPGWWEPIIVTLENPRIGAVSPVISVMGRPASKGFGYWFKDERLGIEWLGRQGHNPHPVPLLAGCCLAMRRDTFTATGGFDNGMQQWGNEDAELSLRLWLLGYELQLIPQVEVAHLFRKQHPYPLSWTSVLYNMIRLTMLHFNPKCITRVMDALKEYRDFAGALSLIADSDTWRRRADLMAHRVCDDDWFFEFSGGLL